MSHPLFAPDFKARPWWWEAAPPAPPGDEALPERADVVVVGSGYTGLHAGLVTARAGQVSDPQDLHPGGEYHSVFKVLESNFGVEPEPLEKVEKRARALLKRAEESRLAAAFLTELRQQNEGQIVIHEDNLKKRAAQ